MPVTVTPADTDRARRSPEDGDHSGGGRRPPIDKRTGGGGDNENWNDRPSGHRGPRERLDSYRLGIFFALAGDLMFFVAIVSCFFVTQASGHFDASARYINAWLPTAIPPILWLNTAVILVSSITMEIARRHMFHEIDVMEEWLGLGKPTTQRAMPWLAATVFLGSLFLVGQWVAWSQLHAQHVFLATNPSSHFFFLITGIHGIHLVLGVAALAAALVALYTAKSIASRQIVVDCAAWYWHSMGLFWIFLFALLVGFQ